MDPTSQEGPGGERHMAKYDWREEWYPLYLTKELPEDAPLGLTVFDKQIVLYRDANSLLRCYEDRCPHRLLFYLLSSISPFFNSKLLFSVFKTQGEQENTFQVFFFFFCAEKTL